jgi:NAD+-dependent protein deacetylase sirtuin 4
MNISEVGELLRGRPVLALTGAGMSTESGIPDYRSPEAAARRVRAGLPDSPRPITYREYVSDPAARARYWARSAIGWPRVAGARPNAGHTALGRLERMGALMGIITQNVDGLHQAAGSAAVLELHGSLSRVVCLSCGAAARRGAVQERLLAENPDWAAGDYRTAVTTPDGDVSAEPPADGSFRVPACLVCGGVLKPDVVFFGENVPGQRVREAYAMLSAAGALLVAGSSLAVYSGYRFVLRAAEEGKPVAIINRGPTRADALAAVRLEEELGGALTALADLFEPRG